MADCPTGILVEICHSPTPEKPTKNFADFLKTLGINYTSEICNTLPALTCKNLQLAVPLTPEDDLITSEIFDFKVPVLEELDMTVLKQHSPPASSDLNFQFPVLVTNPSSTVANLIWNAEICMEAQKVSKRLSLAPFPSPDEDVSDHKASTTESISSVDSENRTYTILSSFTSSEGDDVVFSSSPNKNSVFNEVSEDKENNPRVDKGSPVFVPNSNAEEALTPQGTLKIRGPLLRRGTYTLDKNISTPNKSQKITTSGSCYNQGSAALKARPISTQVPKISSTPSRYSLGSGNSKARQTINQESVITNSTPKMVPRSKSFMRTPQASPRISTFRKESPQVYQNRRSISLDRTQVTRNASVNQHAPQRPLTRKIGGPSPLLRTALGPKPIIRPASSATSGPTNPIKGPMKAPPLRTSGQFQQFSKSGLPTYGSSMTTGQFRNGGHQGSHPQQPRFLGNKH